MKSIWLLGLDLNWGANFGPIPQRGVMKNARPAVWGSRLAQERRREKECLRGADLNRRRPGYETVQGTRLVDSVRLNEELNDQISAPSLSHKLEMRVRLYL